MQVVSDLHLEFRDGKIVDGMLEPHAPILALLGDVGSLEDNSIKYIWYERYLKSCVSRWKTVFLLTGNHEYYNCVIDSAQRKFLDLEKSIPGVIPLEKRKVVIRDGLCVLGTTLWSDVPDYCEDAIQNRMSDYRLIRKSLLPPGARPRKKIDKSRHLMVADTNELHKEAVRWLEAELETCRAQNQKAIVLTHHSPLPPGSRDLLSCGWSTDLTRLMDPTVISAWFYGHTHASKTDVINGVLVKSNQMGYTDPRACGYDPKFQFDITKRV